VFKQTHTHTRTHAHMHATEHDSKEDRERERGQNPPNPCPYHGLESHGCTRWNVMERPTELVEMERAERSIR
jgi:hypothetical protein